MSSSQLVECAPCYDLKYDEATDILRDQTLQELKIAYGRDAKIKCVCLSNNNRDYIINAGFIAHMKSHKHRNWREAQQKNHKQTYGHCISPEKIIETLRKEIRDYKKLYAQSTETINNKNEKLNLMSKKLDEMSDEIDILKNEIEEYQLENEGLKKENEGLKKENEGLKKVNEGLKKENFKKENEDLKMKNNKLKKENENLASKVEENNLVYEEYQNDIINVTKENDRLKYELNKLVAANKKKISIKIGERHAFR